MRATRYLVPVLLAGCSNLARVLPDAPTGEPPARPPEALARARRGAEPPPVSFRLASGLAVVLLPEPGEERLALELRFEVGRRDEGPSTAGAVAEFAARARAAGGPELARRLEEGGAWIVAQPGLDDTRLVALAPRALLPALLELAVAQFAPAGGAPRTSLAPDADAGERALWSTLYPPDHPYRFAAPGAPDAHEVERFLRERFVPAGARLVLAGDFEPAAARSALERTFAPLPARAAPARRPAPPATLEATVRLELSAAGEHAELAFVWHSPAKDAPGDAELELAAALLAEGPAARLVQRLVLDTRLAEEVAASQQGAALGSLFRIDVRTAPGTDLAALERELLDALAEFARRGPTPSELEGARARAEARAELRREGLLARAAAALEPRAERWSAVTSESVRAAAGAVLRAPHVTLVRAPRE